MIWTFDLASSESLDEIIAQVQSVKDRYRLGLFAAHTTSTIWPAWSGVLVGLDRTAAASSHTATAPASAASATAGGASVTSSADATQQKPAEAKASPTQPTAISVRARAYAEFSKLPYFEISSQSSAAEVKQVVVALCERYKSNSDYAEAMSKEFAKDKAKAEAHAKALEAQTTKELQEQKGAKQDSSGPCAIS